MKVLVIFLILIGLVGIASANEPKPFPGELDKPPIEIWNESRAIMDGTITEKKQSEEWTNYDITINEMFKGTTKSKSITGFIPRNMDWILDKGDRALIYLKSGNEISVYSVKSSNTCTPRDLIQISPVLPNDNSIVRGAPVLPWDWKDPCVPNYFTYDPDFWNYMEYKPPLRQYVDHNLPLHMQKCGNDEHVSVIPKSHPYHIACVTESTKQKLIERGWTSSSTIMINSSFEQDRDRIYTDPRNVVIDLQKTNSVKWINYADYTVQVYDYENKSWSTGQIEPNMNDSIAFNNTGYYEFAVESTNDRHFGEIIVISDDTNSLPIETRMKMGMSIVSNDLGKNPALIGVGTGDVNDGIVIDINQNELEKRTDAKSYYYDMYKEMIPFDVPITIEFTEPLRLLE